MEAALIWEYVIKSAIILLGMTLGFAYLTLFEPRVLARMQMRIGPNRAGPEGVLQPIADAVKLIFKEEPMPSKADKLLFILAPVITVFPALVITAVIPWGRQVVILGREVNLYLANVNIGAVYITAIASIAVYGIVLAGWSSNNKYALMGGMRSSAQMISYELTMGLSFIGPIALAGSLCLVTIVERQGELGFLRWNVVQPVGFILFLIARIAR